MAKAPLEDRCPWVDYWTAWLVIILAGCAVPVPPSGGPPDDRPPQVAETDPPDGAVGVRPERVRILFDEFINGRTAQRAVSITPTPNRLPEIRPGERSVEILFREPLRDSTTYIITIDAGLQDAHGVALAAPVRVAFSTGDRINRGRMSGRVIKAADGQPDAALDIYAYSAASGTAPATLPGGDILPDYRTQTDAQGNFSFEYLREAPYFVLGVRDANRNRIPDAGETLAWPPIPVVQADSNATRAGTWMSHLVDTTAAVLRRVSTPSESRLTLRFDDTIRLIDLAPDRWTVGDSTFQETVAILDVYQPLDENRIVMLSTPPLSERRYWVRGVLSDSVGNQGEVGPMSFAGSIRADTTQPRFRGFGVDTLATDQLVQILRPDSHVRLLFAAPPKRALLENNVVVSDTAGATLDWSVESGTGTLLEVIVDAQSSYQVSVDLAAFGGPDSTASILAMAAPSSRLGELVGVVERGTYPAYIRAHRSGIQARNSLQGPLPVGRVALPIVRVDSTGAFVFRGLPGRDDYLLSFFEDANSNGRWDFGGLAPFSAPERLGWFSDPTTIRARWEVAVPDTLQFRPLLPSAQADSTGT